MDGDRIDLGKIASEAQTLRDADAETRNARIDVYLFWSFDLVGSTALKARTFQKFHWVDVIRDFYSQCGQLQARLGVEATTWKYVGDEVLFYRRITESRQIEETVRAVYRTLDAYTGYLADSLKYSDAAPFLSIKSFAWIVPVRSYVRVTTAKDSAYDPLLTSFSGDDQVIEAGGLTDFLGPNIDAGFRIAKFARKKQLVLSAALAAYLIDSRSAINNLRIADFAELKGVAGGALYPEIWYRENWDDLREEFTYEERHVDHVIRRMCANEYEPLETLSEVRARFAKSPFFFDKAALDETIMLSHQGGHSTTEEA